ncbi:MAG: 4-(cytidine 5'-diphospho)-2-C-methyl-D-erythritol kinase [Syntrophorhabdales bacterium]|jgi:4-diphosphocytidyl-2-C-methyl-D-erythritol kinase
MEHELLSPAKVNLYLKVVSKRPDGYHDLVSIVDVISLCDVIHIRETRGGQVVIRDDRGLLPDGPANTIYRAVMLLRERYGIAAGVEVDVEKRIPLGSGLGGGSGNAATVMKELVRIWDLPAEGAELGELGRRVGADVPLFLYGKSCIIRGVGERVSPIDLPAMWYVVVYPNIAISTRDVYNGLRIVLTKDKNDVTVSGKFSHATGIADILENDLEDVAFSLCPAIKTIKERLTEAGALGSLMSGSGSAVFGIFEDERGARKALEELGGLGSVFIAHSIEGGERWKSPM